MLNCAFILMIVCVCMHMYVMFVRVMCLRVCVLVAQECPGGEQDYRSVECQKHNDRYYGGHRYEWEAFINRELSVLVSNNDM